MKTTNIKKHALIAATVGSLLMGSVAAQAGEYNEHQGVYAEAGAGVLVLRIHDSLDDTSDAGVGGLAANAAVGYQFNKNFAAEVGYIPVGVILGEGLHTVHANVKGILPVGNRATVYAKAGVANTSFAGYSKAGLFSGVGASYAVTHKLDVNTQLQGTYLTAGKNSDNVMGGALTAGLTYHFD